jgi:hypothetical protein
MTHIADRGHGEAVVGELEDDGICREEAAKDTHWGAHLAVRQDIRQTICTIVHLVAIATDMNSLVQSTVARSSIIIAVEL